MTTVEVVQQYTSSAVDEKLRWFHVDVDAPGVNVQGLEEKEEWNDEIFEGRSKAAICITILDRTHCPRSQMSGKHGLVFCLPLPFMGISVQFSYDAQARFIIRGQPCGLYCDTC